MALALTVAIFINPTDTTNNQLGIDSTSPEV
jgi:hypothetical protein